MLVSGGILLIVIIAHSTKYSSIYRYFIIMYNKVPVMCLGRIKDEEISVTNFMCTLKEMLYF